MNERVSSAKEGSFLVGTAHSFLLVQKRHAGKYFFTSAQDSFFFFLVEIRMFHVPRNKDVLPRYLIAP